MMIAKDFLIELWGEGGGVGGDVFDAAYADMEKLVARNNLYERWSKEGGTTTTFDEYVQLREKAIIAAKGERKQQIEEAERLFPRGCTQSVALPGVVDAVVGNMLFGTGTRLRALVEEKGGRQFNVLATSGIVSPTKSVFLSGMMSDINREERSVWRSERHGERLLSKEGGQRIKFREWNEKMGTQTFILAASHEVRNVAGGMGTVEGTSQSMAMHQDFGEGRTNTRPMNYNPYSGTGKLYLALVSILRKDLPDDWDLAVGRGIGSTCPFKSSLFSQQLPLPGNLNDYMYVPRVGEDHETFLGRVWEETMQKGGLKR